MERHEGEISAELLNEAVAGDEVRELIKRLHVDWASVGSKATIGDVAEATGQEPRRVAALLAEIRRETFEAEFRRTFGVHGKKIQNLETKTGHLEQKTSRMEKVAFGGDAEIVEQLVEAEKKRRENEPLAYILGAIAIFIVLIVFVRTFSAPTPIPTAPESPRGWSVESRASDGAILKLDSTGKATATFPDGRTRPVTQEERSQLIISGAGFDSSPR